MTEKNVPLISKTAFACPHCGAYSAHNWLEIHAKSIDTGSKMPIIPVIEALEKIRKSTNLNSEAKTTMLNWHNKMLSRKPFIEEHSKSTYGLCLVDNSFISRCYNCSELTIWVHDKIVYPNAKVDIKPNMDLPVHISNLFDEARAIADLSPKGAAALLRLCIQHLCKELGESGKNIDKDIASLVSKGLNPVVKKALDIVRVIGNEAVHPGKINLDDDKDIAIKLFGLVNLICEQMISHPKEVEALYQSLPAEKIKGIEDRDANAIKKTE